jgi:O-antigen ligase
MYNVSWLPGHGTIFSKYVYVIISILFFVIFTAFNFKNFVNLQLLIFPSERILIWLLFLLIIISTVNYNPVELSTINNILVFLSYLLIFIVYFCLIPNLIIKNGNLFSTFIIFISNLGFILAIFGLLDLELNLHDSNYPGMLLSIIHHPNNTSMIFTISFIPVVYFIFSQWKSLNSIKKLYWVSSFCIQLTAQFFTYTRAGMIAILFGLTIFLLLHFRSKAILLIPILGVLSSSFIAFFFKAKGFLSFSSRLWLLFPAYEMISSSKSRMLWGFGINNALLEFKKTMAVIPNAETGISDPHNSYVTLILMLGIVFTFFLVLFLTVIILKSIVRVYKSQVKSEKLFFIFLVSSSSTILIHGLFDAELIKLEYFTIHYLSIIIGLMYYSIIYRKYNYLQLFFKEI